MSSSSRLATTKPIRTERENDSRSKRERANIYLLGRTDPEAEQLAITIVRCGKFLDQYRTASDAGNSRVCADRGRALNDRATPELERKLQAALHGGFICSPRHT